MIGIMQRSLSSQMRVDAVDGGDPSQKASATVNVVIEEWTGDSSEPSLPSSSIHFSHKNFTESVQEALRPPHLVVTLPVENKPEDTRLISCSINSGNFRGLSSYSLLIDEVVSQEPSQLKPHLKRFR